MTTDWDEILSLHVVRKLGKLIHRRWGLGMGFVSVDGRAVPPGSTSDDAPRVSRLFAELYTRGELEPSALTYTCHSGLQEIAVPVVIEDRYLGCLVVGAFATIPWHEVSYLNELLELCAEEITVFQTEVARREKRVEELTRELGTRYSYDAIIGRSRPMQDLYRLLDKVIDSESTVLIQGENGTGKELIAKAIHYNSPRKQRRFLVQNCSAFNDNLLDSELFGHRKGAFTGAIADKQGLFEVADGGTFFLDEIGDMSPALQVKLLRVLQEGTFIPVGDTSPRQVDVRIIAATNRDLKRMVERGEFREDLFYRVNVINLVLPSLRERKDDIAILVEHFLKKHAKGRAKGKRLTKTCLDRLLEYAWPGNVRELENEIERLVVLAGEERVVGEELLSPRVRRDKAGATGPEPNGLPDAKSSLERSMIYEVLRRNHWNKTRAAADLKISRRNLIRLVQKYQLEQRRRS